MFLLPLHSPVSPRNGVAGDRSKGMRGRRRGGKETGIGEGGGGERRTEGGEVRRWGGGGGGDE